FSYQVILKCRPGCCFSSSAATPLRNSTFAGSSASWLQMVTVTSSACARGDVRPTTAAKLAAAIANDNFMADLPPAAMLAANLAARRAHAQVAQERPAEGKPS